jgi:branched-chain amino acid transport system permease protein
MVVLLLLPFYLQEFWLRVGLAVFAGIIGAIGLNLLVGTAGQLSLAHGAFLAVGAITYTYLSGSPERRTGVQLDGLGLPPLLSMVLAVLAAGLAGLIFSPIAARLKGIYLGVASIALVFIAVHALNNLKTVTGGFNGRTVPDFSLFGFSFTDDNPNLFVAGVEFDQAEKLWYLGLALAVLAYLFARNLLRSRPGRALQTLRDSETAAAVMGVNVQRYRATAFLVSSMYAGLAGVLYALSITNISAESFQFDLSILFLAMIIIGGLGSVAGAVVGAVFVTALPLVLEEYADSLESVPLLNKLLDESGTSGFTPTELSRFVFGAGIILVIMFEPAGLAGLGRRLGARMRRRPTARAAPEQERAA